MNIKKIISISLGTILVMGLFGSSYKLQKKHNFVIPEKTRVVYERKIDRTKKLKK